MNNLKTHRIKEGYTQEGMAWKFKISQQRYSNYENNRRRIQMN